MERRPTEARPKAVVFDMDGLMVNTESIYREVARRLLQRRDKQVPGDLLDRMMGRPGPAAMQVMIQLCGLEEDPQSLIQESDALFEALLDERLRPMPGLMELLDALESARVPKAVATSSRRRLATRVLDPIRVRDRFEFVLTGEDVRRGKPEPDIYLLAAQRLQVPPAQMAVLEDSHHGCRAAVASGAVAVAVPADHSRHHDFDGARLVADGLADPRLWSLLGLP